MDTSSNTATEKSNKEVTLGNVYVMTHSLFSDIIKVGCTPEDPNEYAKSLSAKTIGEYSLVFSLQCEFPCRVKRQIKEYLSAQEYVNEFYQVSPEVAAKLLTRETLKIPVISN
ncbi:GIY-YIG nuclease family protein [Colwellia sp. E2M01]|uniref:GIY-YIG nuclease family protein n=1 Tax=Colwellia sp. E2M01 TaxID=2841561 RepID=UPI001C09B6A5|nr:GIY-YIG nuclease family protein [Colwellia sp. E2M01]MBU2870007.1 GIY-YIG nuclease family protein [Colwellia sp. E2M01]